MKVRRIGGLQFALVDSHSKKSVAQADAKDIRQRGYNARVVKSGKVWQVWREVV